MAQGRPDHHRVLRACERRGAETDASAVADSIQHLVKKGRLEAQGGLSKWGHSEVRRRGEADAECDNGSSRGASSERESTTVVASRTLMMDVDGGEIEVRV